MITLRRRSAAIAGTCKENTEACTGGWKPGESDIVYKNFPNTSKGVPICTGCAEFLVQTKKDVRWASENTKEPVKETTDSLSFRHTNIADDAVIKELQARCAKLEEQNDTQSKQIAWLFSHMKDTEDKLSKLQSAAKPLPWVADATTSANST